MPDYVGQLNRARKKYSSIKKMNNKVQKIAQPTSEISTVEFFLIGSVAVISDACDYIGLDLILFRSIDLVTSFILGFWCLFRLHKFPSARFGITFIIELIPILGDISPTWTIFIISIYFKQKANK